MRKLKIAAVFIFILINNIGAFITLRNENKALKLNINETSYQSVYNEMYEFKTGINQNIDTIYVYKWNETENYWELAEKNKNIFNQKENIREIDNFLWNSEYRNFENTSKSTYKYNDFEKVVEKVVFLFEDYAWQENKKTEDYYDDDGSLLKSIDFEWERDSNKWVEVKITENKFNKYRRISTSDVSTWDEVKEDWIHKESISYHYSSEEDTINQVYQEWYQDSAAWITKSKTEKFFIDSVHYQETKYLWNDTADENWVKYEYIVSTFNAKNFEIESNKYEFDTESETWYSSQKYEYVFNEDSLLSKRKKYNWDETTKSLILDKQLEFTYNEDGKWIETNELDWNQTYKTLENYRKWDIDFEPHEPHATLASKENKKSKINVFPNPTSGFVTIKSSNNTKLHAIEVYDITGKKIIHESFNSPVYYLQFNLKSYPQGMYFFKVETDAGIIQRKLNVVN